VCANAIAEDAARLHREAIVIDHVTDLVLSLFPEGSRQHLAGGVTVVGQTASAGEAGGAEETFRKIAEILSLIRQAPELLTLIEQADDVHRAKADGKLGVMLHFQTCSPFERDLSLIEMFYRLGVRVALLTYNIQNYVADGITESSNAGLTRFGRRVIAEMNRVGMVVDCSHTGEKATLQAIELSDAPVIFSHSSCKAVYDHPRNITDEQIRACAASGGVVGVLGLPYFISESRTPTLDHVIRHIEHIAELVGTDHIGLGMDYWTGICPYSTPEQQVERLKRQEAAADLWNPGDIPVHPWSLARELVTPEGMPHLTAALLQRGFVPEDVRKILGANLLRVFSEVWKPVA
jgi:membrane dipeptidase